MPSAPRATGHFWKLRWALSTGTRTTWLGLGMEVGVDTPESYLCVCMCMSPAGKHSSILNWQDCEVPGPQPHSPEPSSQCVAAQLYPLPQQPPTSLPRSPGPTAGSLDP